MITFLSRNILSKCALLLACMVIIYSQPVFAQKSFKERSWTTAFYANCKLPRSKDHGKSVSWVKIGKDRKVQFKLLPGQVGGCGTDDMVRHGAPFWERAELRQKDYMQLGRIHRISFQALFLEGFTGERETFFQIHGWNGACEAYPPLMMKFHNGRLRIDTLANVGEKAGQEWMSNEQGSHRTLQFRTIKIENIYNRPQQFDVVLDATGERSGLLSVSLNGMSVVEKAKIEYAPCAKPHVKFGIYRPGRGLAASRVLFDNLSIRQEAN